MLQHWDKRFLTLALLHSSVRKVLEDSTVNITISGASLNDGDSSELLSLELWVGSVGVEYVAIDGKILALALKRAPVDIREFILSNLSERARNILTEDMDAMGKVRVRDVDKAQTAIVSAVRRLEESGEIQLNREDEKYV